MYSIEVYDREGEYVGTMDLTPAPDNVLMELLTINTPSGDTTKVLHVIDMDYGWVINTDVALQLELKLKAREV